MSEDPTKMLSEGVSNLARDVYSIKERLQQLEEKFEARSRETRPMSERVDQILVAVVDTRHELLDMRRELVDTRQEFRHELREVNRTLRRMNLDFATVLRNQDELEDRVEKLEERPAES
ncbi:MAG TPA: hypothetical protein VN643_19460 [Pyrinomonadaceae bacterium]|nr:hypothetical protein [Pyrinomonadaceae bacterium]